MALFRMSALALLLVCLTLAAPTAQSRPGPTPEQYSRLHWRTIGPEGNRFSAAAGIAGNPHIYYVGAASGGIWKTTDGGTNWTPDLRRPAGAVDRIARRGALRSQHRVGGHRRGQDPQPHLARPGHLQVDGRRQDVDADGSRADRTHPATGRPSHESRHRARLRARPRLRSAGGARRVPHDRRRRHLDEDALHRREQRLLGHRDGPDESAHPVRRHVDARDPHLGSRQRRPGQRALHVARRRRDVDAAAGSRPAHQDRWARWRWRSRLRTRSACSP